MFTFQIKSDRGESLVVALEFEIENRMFDRFRRPFITDKYITIVQWEEITRNIEKRVHYEMKNKTFDKSRTMEEEEFIVDDSLCVKYQLLPKQQSYINFKKIKFDFRLDWFVSVKVSKKSNFVIAEVKSISITEESEIVPEAAADTEYDPRPNSNEFPAMSSYTASRKVPTENRASVEYSPSSSKQIRNTSISPVKYTPTKIPSHNNNVGSDNDDDIVHTQSKAQKAAKTSKLQEEIFGAESSDDLADPENFQKKKKGKKRTLLTLPEEGEKEVPTGKKSRKRVQHTPSSSHEGSSIHRLRSNDKKVQGSLDVWISAESKSTHVDTPIVEKTRQTRKPSKSSKAEKSSVMPAKVALEDPMAGINEEQLRLMDVFLEKHRQKDIAENQRRLELENLQILSCNHLTKNQLKHFVRDFSPTIKTFFEMASSNLKQQKTYNPMMMSTSGVLTDSQISFALREIENRRDFDDRGTHETMLMETILPEFIIYVFCQEFNFSKEEALDQLAKQEEHQLLFMKNDSSL